MRSIALISNSTFSLVTFRGDLIRALSDQGVRVFALAPDHDPASRKHLASLGAEPVDYALDRVGLSPLRDSVHLFRLVSLLRRLKPDAVLSYFIKPVIYGTIAAALAGVPRRLAMLEGLGYYFTAPHGRRPRLVAGLLKLLFRVAGTLSHRFLFLNRDDVQLFERDRLVNLSKTGVVGAIGVNLDTFKAVPIPDGPASFVMVGRLLREKGIYEFVAAARRVKSAYSDASFTIVGGLDSNPGGISKAEVEAWVAEGILNWTGHVADVRPWIERASVFVLPSYREGVPRSTQEAMALGRAVITTDAPGCRDTVVHGVNGLLVPPFDTDALADAMLKLAGDDGVVIQMGKESRVLAQRWFDVHRANRILMREIGVGTCVDN